MQVLIVSVVRVGHDSNEHVQDDYLREESWTEEVEDHEQILKLDPSRGFPVILTGTPEVHVSKVAQNQLVLVEKVLTE